MQDILPHWALTWRRRREAGGPKLRGLESWPEAEVIMPSCNQQNSAENTPLKRKGEDLRRSWTSLDPFGLRSGSAASREAEKNRARAVAFWAADAGFSMRTFERAVRTSS